MRRVDDNEFVFIITDYYSEFGWIFFLEDKKDTFKMFSMFYGQGYDTEGLSILHVRSEHRTEFKGEFI